MKEVVIDTSTLLHALSGTTTSKNAMPTSVGSGAGGYICFCCNPSSTSDWNEVLLKFVYKAVASKIPSPPLGILSQFYFYQLEPSFSVVPDVNDAGCNHSTDSFLTAIAPT
jgi:hypothetical protein